MEALDNQMRAVLGILKSPETLYNANNLSKVLGISSMGTLKILKRLEHEGVLEKEKIGNSFVVRINTGNEHSRKYLRFALSKEVLGSSPLVKRWVTETKKIKFADMAVLFGSVLKKTEPNDIDVLFVTDKRRFQKLGKEIEEINRINIKKIHPVYQSFDDIVKNIKKGDKVMLNAIKGVVVFGEESFMEIYESCRK